MKQTENISVDTNKPGMQPNTPPQKPLSPDTFSK